jgi:hypothetical protein
MKVETIVAITRGGFSRRKVAGDDSNAMYDMLQRAR